MNSIKICRVCGGIASGFNYDGLSCESCKVFFCRNSTRLEKLTCKYKENCEIKSTITRKCLKCRLVKCFSIGMKKKEETNLEIKTQNKIDLTLEISIRKQISNYEIRQITGYLSNTSKNSKITKKRVPLELNFYERECISESQQAICVFQDELNAKVIKRVNNVHELVESPLMTNLLYIKKTIQFCQNFAAFNSLTNEDQLTMLKSTHFNLMQIRFIFQSNSIKDGILMFTDESEQEAILIENEIDSCYMNQDMVKKFADFSFSLYNAMENDVNIRNLVSTLVLFKVSKNLSNPENVRYYYALYCTILQRYLQRKCSNKKEGNRKYIALIRILDRIDVHFNEHKKIMALEFGMRNMPTIIQELFDLK